jgi:glycosyltransferase involved in cell wall biosynthesis
MYTGNLESLLYMNKPTVNEPEFIDLNVGLVIPTHNSLHTLIETLESLRNQSTDICLLKEIIIVDDHSIDDTFSFLQDSWIKAIPNIKIIKSFCDPGQWHTTNLAINMVSQSSDWVLILHADDIAEVNWIEKTLKTICQADEKVGTICSSWSCFMNGGAPQGGEYGDPDLPRRIFGNAEAAASTVQSGGWWHISGCAIRAKAYQSAGSFDQHFTHMGDIQWLVRMLRNSWDALYIPYPLIRYRMSSESVSSKSFRKCIDLSDYLKLINQNLDIISRSQANKLHIDILNNSIRRLISGIVRSDALKSIFGLRLFFITFFRLILAHIFYLKKIYINYLFQDRQKSDSLKSSQNS